MKAARFYGPGDIRVEEIERVAQLPAGHVRLQILAAGICGSDIHNFKTGQWIATLPVTPGHEFSGQVIQLADDVDNLRVGDMVVSDSKVYCGRCEFCKQGKTNLCSSLAFVGEANDGGFAEETVQPAFRLHKVPEGVPGEVAALSEPLAVALHVVTRLAMDGPSTVLVAGGGPVGGLVAVALSEQGHRVLLVERNDARAEALVSMGNIERVPLDNDSIRDATGGNGADYCVEATGAPAVLSSLIEVVKAGGRIAMVGIPSGSIRTSLTRLVEREIDIVGCSAFSDEQTQALEMLPKLADKLRTLISAPITLDDVPTSYGELCSGNTRYIKTIVTP
jgi:(R,R)-butanediol dehydrogenase / meso-butanediol dehydrogenase / diacetyl reductase